MKDKMTKSLEERAREISTSTVQLHFMENREKGSTEDILDEKYTITDYGFLEDEDGKKYVCFVLKEDNKSFYFGGKVLTQGIEELDADGYHEAIVKNGLPVRFSNKKAKKSKKNYTAVEFYPN